MNRGFAAAAASFLLWGLFPLYWKLLDHVPALEIMTHRLCWCFLFVTAYLQWRHGSGWLRPILAERRLLAMLCASGLIIGLNWYVYIWGVTHEHIVETSLGYFINPLVSVLLGVVALKERLNRAQWTAIGVAACSVGYMTWQVGHPPWIALTLAVTFGSYGLIRKLAAVGSVQGLAVENGLLLAPAAGFLLWHASRGSGHFGVIDPGTDALLVLGGLVTAIPLVLFAYGARRIPLATVGILQYLAPSLQLLTGVAVFGEAFTRTDAIGFGGIWVALGIYASDGLHRLRRGSPAPVER